MVTKERSFGCGTSLVVFGTRVSTYSGARNAFTCINGVQRAQFAELLVKGGVKSSERQNAKMPTRECVICRKLLERRLGEKSQGFKLRQTCGAECSNKLRSKTQTRIRDKTGTGRCLVCAEPLERREYANGKLEPLNKFEKGRRTCSPECCNKLRGMSHKERGNKRVEGLSPRFCNLCGRQLERRDGERPNAFCKRTTCCVRVVRVPSLNAGHASSSEPTSGLRPASRTRRARACGDAERGDPPKICLGCNRPMARRQDEKRASFVRRKTCSPECTRKHWSAVRSKTTIIPGRRCLVCDELLVRKNYEMPNIFAKRKTCNNVCRLMLLQNRVRLFNFYGEQLSREVIIRILGLSKTGVRHRFP